MFAPPSLWGTQASVPATSLLSLRFEVRNHMRLHKLHAFQDHTGIAYGSDESMAADYVLCFFRLRRVCVMPREPRFKRRPLGLIHGRQSDN